MELDKFNEVFEENERLQIQSQLLRKEKAFIISKKGKMFYEEMQKNIADRLEQLFAQAKKL